MGCIALKYAAMGAGDSFYGHYEGRCPPWLLRASRREYLFVVLDFATLRNEKIWPP